MGGGGSCRPSFATSPSSRSSTARELRAIDPPTLVVVGDRDPFTPVPQAHALARQVRDGRLLVMPGIGHDVLTDGGELLEPMLAAFYRSTATIALARSGEADDDVAPFGTATDDDTNTATDNDTDTGTADMEVAR